MRRVSLLTARAVTAPFRGSDVGLLFPTEDLHYPEAKRFLAVFKEKTHVAAFLVPGDVHVEVRLFLREQRGDQPCGQSPVAVH